MRRRRNEAETISLFSFQDIMASVIGMLFFVVILLSLSIVTEVLPASADSSSGQRTTDMAFLRTKVQELRDERSSLEARIARTSEKLIHATALDPQATLSELKQMRSNLSALYKTIGEEEATLQDMMARAEPKRKDIEEKRKRLQKVQNEIAQCKAKLKGLQSAPRLAFIIDEHPDRLEPWLLEVSKDRIRVGAKDGRSSIVEFRAKTAQERLKLFLAWAKNQDQRTHYFVILLKPSAVALLGELQQTLEKIGFDIGLDLLPEDWEPF